VFCVVQLSLLFMSQKKWRLQRSICVQLRHCQIKGQCARHFVACIPDQLLAAQVSWTCGLHNSRVSAGSDVLYVVYCYWPACVSVALALMLSAKLEDSADIRRHGSISKSLKCEGGLHCTIDVLLKLIGLTFMCCRSLLFSQLQLHHSLC
jgi:hypothetical protein